MPSLYPSFVTHAVSGLQSSLIYRAVARQLETMPNGPTHDHLEMLLAQLGDDVREATLREQDALLAGDLIELVRGTSVGEQAADYLDARREGRAA
jgi:hypothetical protein